MKLAAVLLLAFSGVSLADDATKPDASKRLESVTWDLKTHKLTWVVETGSDVGGEFVQSSEERYEITPDEAVMAFDEEKRGFTKMEAKSLHKLLDTLSLYCAESVVWWDEGQGVPLDPDGSPSDQKEKSKPQDKGQKVGQPAPKKAAPVREGDMVASARGY